LYTAITTEQCPAQWDYIRLVKGIEDVIVLRRMTSVHKDYFDNAMRQRKPFNIARALFEAMCDQLRAIPFEELIHFFIGHAAPAVYMLMKTCDKLIESLQKMLGDNSQIVSRYFKVFELLESSRYPFAAFVKIVIDHATGRISSTKNLSRRLAELPGINFDNWPSEGERTITLADLHARSRLCNKDMLVLRPSIVEGLRKSMFESFNDLFIDLAAMEDNFAQDPDVLEL
jgi:hypothetical protein